MPGKIKIMKKMDFRAKGLPENKYSANLGKAANVLMKDKK